MAQRNSKIGSLPWEDEASAEESRFRRVQQVSPRVGRTLPGMPVEMDPEGEEELPRRRKQFETPKGPWYKPKSKFGRVVLGSGVAIVLSAATLGALAVKHALERDGRFRIAGTENIQAGGLTQVSRADILPVFGEDIGKNIFFIHLGERRKQLEQIPWIEKATVMRLLPDRIRVSVVERTPIAFVREGQQIELVDSDGVLLTMSPQGMTEHRYSFPVVTGIDPRDPLESRRARMAVYRRLIGDLDSAGQHLSAQISEIDLTDPEDARVLMPEQGADILAHFGDEQFLTRYQRYKAHIGDWRQQYPHLAAVDLRYDSQVVLQMAPGSGTVTSTTASTAADTVAGTTAGTAAGTAAVNAGDGKPPAGAVDHGMGAKPSPDAMAAVASTKALPKTDHKAISHHATKPAPKSAAQREKEKRGAARKAVLAHKQRAGNPTAANRLGQ